MCQIVFGPLPGLLLPGGSKNISYFDSCPGYCFPGSRNSNPYNNTLSLGALAPNNAFSLVALAFANWTPARATASRGVQKEFLFLLLPGLLFPGESKIDFAMLDNIVEVFNLDSFPGYCFPGSPNSSTEPGSAQL